jgi:catechol 2,3-dioxygenase-like lactoylglutathione lyase family enzyme
VPGTWFTTSATLERVAAAVRYIVKNVDESVAFFVGQLGFALDQQFGPNMAIVSRADATVWLAGPGASASRPMPDGAQPEPGGWSRLVLTVEGLDELVAGLAAQGAVFRNAIVKGPGGRQILVEDPSGNCVELFEPA